MIVSTISLEAISFVDYTTTESEFDEWFDPKDDLEVIAIDEISEDDYNNFVDYMNDGMEIFRVISASTKDISFSGFRSK